MTLSEFQDLLTTETADQADWDRDPEVVAAIVVAPGHIRFFALEKVYMHDVGLILELGRAIR